MHNVHVLERLPTTEAIEVCRQRQPRPDLIVNPNGAWRVPLDALATQHRDAVTTIEPPADPDVDDTEYVLVPRPTPHRSCVLC